MTNLDIRVFSESIRNYVNQNSLPTEVKRMVLSDILKEVVQKSEMELAEEIRKKEKKEEENAESI